MLGAARRLTQDVLTTGRHNGEALASLVRYEVDRALGRLGLASAEEVQVLSERVQQLERAVRGLAADSASVASSGRGTR